MDWGTERVFNQTQRTIRRLGLSLMELDPLQDTDRPEDLVTLRKDSRFNTVLKKKPLVSVIIPTHDEEAVLGRTLEHLSREDGLEIIVSDGGSRDTTREIASKNGAVVLNVPGGRAMQQNAGAAGAKGELLLFLHADTVLPSGYLDLIRNALDNPSTVAGAFRFRTDSSRLSMRFIEWSTNIRSSIFQWPYGDQGLFMKKRIFDEEGGFAAMPIMEDFEFVRRLRRRGRIVTIHQPAITSARRWESLGSVRTILINQIMVAGFYLKVPIPLLERIYRNTGSRSQKSKQACAIG